ncbi:MAG: hypothetical protein JSR28_17935 [Proteobacteria bacterium]|nr:hypothetical protein [Pseudomonadota bacterium]
MATTPLTVDEISRTILERMTSNHGGSLVDAIDDGAFVVDDQAVAYWVGQAVELARQGIDDDTETDAPPVGYSCAECGVQDAYNYVVTILDHEDIRHTRTEVCIPCAVTVSAESVDKIIAELLTP